MQVTIVNPSVLGGLGGGGSYGVGTTGSPTPAIGPMGGDAGTYDIAVSFANPGDGITAEASEPLPAHIDSGGPAPIATPAPSMTETVNGGPHTVVSQYSTQGPIPKG